MGLFTFISISRIRISDIFLIFILYNKKCRRHIYMKFDGIPIDKEINLFKSQKIIFVKGGKDK